MKSRAFPVVLLVLTLSVAALSAARLSDAALEDEIIVDAGDNDLIDFDGFIKVAGETSDYRRQRLLTEDRFLEMSRDPGTIVLDSRGPDSFARLRVAGAVNLPFSDFTEQALAGVIPEKQTRVLIYCNNNFSPAPRSMPTKSPMFALNVPTFINLVGYGYENVYELGVKLDPGDTRLRFAGSDSLSEARRPAAAGS